MISILILLRQSRFPLTRITRISNILNYKISSKNVKGRLAENTNFWKQIRANSKKLNVLKEGYKIPFSESPSESFSNNNASALKIWIVVEAVSELVQNKCVVETSFKPFVVSPLSVSINKFGYYAAIGSLYGHVVCYDPASGKASRDWNCLWHGWAVTWWLNYTDIKVECSLVMPNTLFALN